MKKPSKPKYQRKNPREATSPFTSNLDYLVTATDYLKSLVYKRHLQQMLGSVSEGDIRFTPLDIDSKRRKTGSDNDLLRPVDIKRELQRVTLLVEQKWALFSKKLRMTLDEGKVSLPLEELAKEHNLSLFEKLTLILILSGDIDNNFKQLMEAVFAYQHGGEVKVLCVLHVLCESVEEVVKSRKYFVSDGKLFSQGLLNLSFGLAYDSEAKFMQMELEIPRKIVSRILGEYDVDDQVISFSAIVEPKVSLDQVILPANKKNEVADLFCHRDEYLEKRRQWGFDDIISYGKGMVVMFSGPSGTGKTMLAHALANLTGRRLMLVDLSKIDQLSLWNFEDNFKRIFHEAHLLRAIVLFDEADELFADRLRSNRAIFTLLREIEKMDCACIMATNRRYLLDEALERRVLYKLDFEMPTPRMREQIWRQHIPAMAPVASDIDYKALADKYEFSGGYIKNAILLGLSRAISRNGAEQVIAMQDLEFGARTQLMNRLESHSDKITPKASLDDVILMDSTKRQVRAFISAAQKRSTVFNAWGFGNKMNLGKSISCLFIGPSGVGKTMTAEAICYELGQNLYIVSLPAILNKYVGETEKNLQEIFKSAKESQSVLFFDEADAIFSQRSDNNSLFGNMLINILLQELEKYDGIVILATNRPNAFDKAFERRIRYRIAFEDPSIKERMAIWRNVFPADAPMAPDIDFEYLATTYEISGGAIKNVALRAAFCAASDETNITQALLEQCAEEEIPLDAKKRVGFVG